eukprot:14302-Pelagococcus_subviridis.AAC.8
MFCLHDDPWRVHDAREQQRARPRVLDEEQERPVEDDARPRRPRRLRFARRRRVGIVVRLLALVHVDHDLVYHLAYRHLFVVAQRGQPARSIEHRVQTDRPQRRFQTHRPRGHRKLGHRHVDVATRVRLRHPRGYRAPLPGRHRARGVDRGRPIAASVAFDDVRRLVRGGEVEDRARRRRRGGRRASVSAAAVFEGDGFALVPHHDVRRLELRAHHHARLDVFVVRPGPKNARF